MILARLSKTMKRVDLVDQRHPVSTGGHVRGTAIQTSDKLALPHFLPVERETALPTRLPTQSVLVAQW